MSIDSINARNVSGVSLENAHGQNNGVSIDHVLSNISNGISKAVNRAGEDVVEKDANGSTYTFTPYYSSDGRKMVMIQTDSSRSQTSISVSTKSIPFEMMEKFCSSKNIAVPFLNYN